jgi:hypothetical protein
VIITITQHAYRMEHIMSHNTTYWTVEDGANFKPQLSQFNQYLHHDGDCIAGGFAKHVFTGARPRDLDLYFINEQNMKDTYNRMISDGWEQSYTNANATGLRRDHTSVDLVTYSYGTAENIINGFDFSITKFAYRMIADGKSIRYEAVFHPDFFEHLTTHRLVIDDDMVMPLSTFQRMFKYTRYGYNMCRESKVKLLMAIREWTGTTDINHTPTTNDLEEALSSSLYESID